VIIAVYILICKNSQGKLTYMNRAKTACRCIFIKKEVFQELEKKYPSDLKKIKSLAYFRSSYFRYVIFLNNKSSLFQRQKNRKRI